MMASSIATMMTVETSPNTVTLIINESTRSFPCRDLKYLLTILSKFDVQPDTTMAVIIPKKSH